MTDYLAPPPSEAEVREAIDELCDLRDELYLAGYDVPMPVEPDREQRIQEILAAHRTAPAGTAPDPVAPRPVAPRPVAPRPATDRPRHTRRRIFALAGATVAVAAGGGWLADQLRPRQAYAATPRALGIRPVAGDARRWLEQIAGRVALSTAPPPTAPPPPIRPVEHLVTRSWALNSTIDGRTVTSAVIATQRELWREGDRGRIVEQNLPPEFPSEEDRATWREDGSPGADRAPRRTDLPPGQLITAWTDRPPTEPGRLRRWLRRADSSDAAIPVAVADLLRERVLTVPERLALLRVLATEPGLRLLGTTADRAGRTGLVFATTSSSGGGEHTYRLVISPDTGTVLAHEHILTGGADALRVRYPAVIGYDTYVTAEFVPAIP
jgi:hypothetical protein